MPYQQGPGAAGNAKTILTEVLSIRLKLSPALASDCPFAHSGVRAININYMITRF